MVDDNIKFVKTSTSKLEGVQEDYPNSFIHVHDEGDSDADDVLYIGKDKITDRLNAGGRDVTTATQGVGGLESSTIGGLMKKSVSDIIIDIVTPADKPLDSRLVVDSKADLLTIDSPYKGMVVNIKGSSALWILVGDDPTSKSSWELVTGNSSGEVEARYSLPVMTTDMVEEAEQDPASTFDRTQDSHILVDEGLNPVPSDEEENVYLGLMRDMASAIRALQAEVARLKNSFDYGIDSYKNTRTAKSTILGGLDVESSEPLWAIDPGYLSLVPDSTVFNTLLDHNHSFIPIGDVTIDVSVEGQLTFNNGGGKFYDGKRVSEAGEELQFDDYTLYKLNDSKLITYLVTNKPDIKMNLVSLDNRSIKKTVNFAPLMNNNTVNKYGFCVVISRKEKTTGYGFNYIYFSIINYETNKKLYEGYLNESGGLSDTRVDLGDNERYSIESIEFDRLTLYRMKFYTKFEDFSEEVISSAPSESDYKYEVAHIAIRSVKNKEMLDAVADHLRDNELIWNKASGTLHIKSDGKVYTIGSNANPDDDNNNDKNMTDKQIVDALKKMGIIVNAEYNEETEEIVSLSNISLAPISDVTFINEDTDKKFTFSVDPEGNLVGKDKSMQTIEEYMTELGNIAGKYDLSDWPDGYVAYRGFSSDYLLRKAGEYQISVTEGVNKTTDAGKQSDRLRISSFYAPITTDDKHGCTHSFIELENSSPVDIPLTGVYLHFYNPAANNYQGKVYHLALDGVIKAGGTYLVRGAKHAEFDDESAFIKVKTFDKEWYDNKELVSFEQEPVKTSKSGTTESMDNDSNIKTAYRFCLTYGLPNLAANDKLVEANPGSDTYKTTDFPTKIVNPRFIDSCSYSTFASVSEQTGDNNPWYTNGGSGKGITIKPNTMFRLTFALDPARQAFNGFNKKDSSRVRYNSANDIQILNLDKEYIGYPNSKETIKIDRYTPKASFENRNVMTDKSQLNREKPNMVTCSFGVDVYNTRCFNWISCGTFDEYVWLRKQGTNSWTSFQSYVKLDVESNEDITTDTFATTTTDSPIRKEYSKLVNNTVYARMINRFPGNDVLFTAHKCVVVLPDASSTPEVYEYVVGRPDKDGNPDMEHTNEIYTFTLYPRSYEGRVYQITDQQGFHWIEYQVWAASAEFLNGKIAEECNAVNGVAGNTKVFPILINTGDMTQSGARINEWLDYYNGGVCLFNHLEQMNCVGNNDLCPINPRELGTGNDSDKSSSHFFHYFYCFDVKDTEKYNSASADDKKFFSGESLIVRKHSGSVPTINNSTIYIDVLEDKYIPSQYYFKTKDIMYIIVNSEIPITNVQGWFGLCSSNTEASNNKYVNIYTGIEVATNGMYAESAKAYFTPIYETMYAWLKSNQDEGNNSKKVVVAMHEMPFTVITRASLTNKNVTNSSSLPATRNHPNGKDARVGSNVNQLTRAENRGVCWCSRLLESFNCKLVIGGHKHTYALSYPIKEKYSWTYNGTTIDSGVQPKPMSATLADEADGETPTYNISWNIDLDNNEVREDYNIDSNVADTEKLNSTKTPYIPNELYLNCGESAYNANKTGFFRCCTPIDTTGNTKYDGFVTYSMCQATGYKLKSNKELPWKIQVFSKIIPKTDKKTEDKPNPNQLYPMYSVLEYEYENNAVSGINVSMNRITGIFLTDGGDAFTQLDYGKGKPEIQMLRTGNDVDEATRMFGEWVSEEVMNQKNKDQRYLHIKF